MRQWERSSAFGRRRAALAAVAVVGLLAAEAGAAPPCADAARHPALTPLARALERPETWREALEGVPAGAGPMPGEGPDVAACRHYLVGAAAFFLSERSAELAPRAVEHLLAAHLLAPRAMTHVQAHSRLRTAWGRQKALPGIRHAAAAASVELAATGAAYPFTLRPAEADGPSWHLPAPPPGTTPEAASVAHLPLPPGRYRATVNGRCGGSDIDFMVASGTARVTLPAPPPCFVHLAAVDAEGRALADARVVGPDGAAVDPTRVPAEGGEALVSAPGYQIRRVPLATSTGRKIVPLERCPVAIVVDPVPADAQVDGAGAGPWGTRRVTIRRAGYADRELVTEISAPASCEAATATKLTVRLARPVRFSARMDDGLAAAPRLTIDGVDAPTTGLELEPGTHRYEARLPESPPVNGRLVVPACTDAHCPPVFLDVTIPANRPAPTRLGPLLVLGAGGLAFGGGLVAGASALAVQNDIDDYSTRRSETTSIDTLVDRRDERARTADALLTTGVTLAAAGLLWYWLGGE